MSNPQNIIIYSTADWDNPFWTNKQYVALHLSQRQFRILYIESLGLRAPTLKGSDFSRLLQKLIKFLKGWKKINTHLYVFSPLAIPGASKWFILKTLSDFLVRVQIRVVISLLRFQSHWAWTYNPMSYKLLCYFKPQKIIYHSVDDLTAAPGMDSASIDLNERVLLKNADHIFCTSKKLFNKYKDITLKPVYYYPNVVDLAHFSSAHNSTLPMDLKNISSPRLGFVGAISEYKLDMALINTTAAKHPEWSFIFIGKVGEGQPNSTLNFAKAVNIHLLGPKSIDEVPQYMHHFDVGLIPCPSNDYTESMFPMKFFEYLASDTPVVAKNINSLKEFQNIHFSYSSASEFEQKILQALNAKNTYTKNLELLKEYTWQKRLDKMLEQI